MEDFLQQYGLLAALIGGFYQGEAIYMAAMVTVSMGYLDPYSTAGSFLVGSLLRDWITFYLARTKGENWVAKNEKRQERADWISAKLARYPSLTLLSYRFIYGLKLFIIVAVGLTKISWPKFLLLSFISNVFWIISFGAIGYFCGEMAFEYFTDLGQYAWPLIVILASGFVGYWLFHKHWHKPDCPDLLAEG